MMDKIINAGIEAMAALTINTTIDQKGILTSTMLTSFVLLSFIFSLQQHWYIVCATEYLPSIGKGTVQVYNRVRAGARRPYSIFVTESRKKLFLA